jgi:hypothetical protein
LKKVNEAGKIVVTLENCESHPINNVSIIVKAPSDILKISPKEKLLLSVEAGQTSKAHFSATPKTSNTGFAVTTRYKYGNNLYIHTSDHIVQV